MLQSQARNSAALIVAAALLAPPRPAAAASAPEPDELLDAVVNPPDVSYEGKLLLAHWYGKQSRAEELKIYRAAPGRVRREFLSPDGTAQLVVISNGDN